MTNEFMDKLSKWFKYVYLFMIFFLKEQDKSLLSIKTNNS